MPYFTGSGTAALAAFTGSAWDTWSATISSSGGTITSSTVAVARYQRIGKTIIAAFDFTVTNAGTGSGFLGVTLPVQVSASGTGAVTAYIFNTGAAAVAGINASGTNIALVKYDGSSIVSTGNRLQGTAIYEGI